MTDAEALKWKGQVMKTTLLVQSLIARVLSDHPQFTGSIVLNFHQGNMSERAEVSNSILVSKDIMEKPSRN